MENVVIDAINDLQAEVAILRTSFSALTKVLVVGGKLPKDSIDVLATSIANTIEMVGFRDVDRKEAERKLHASWTEELNALLRDAGHG